MRDPPPPLFLALEVPDFPSQAIAAWDGSWRDKPFVVVDQDPGDHRTFILSCSPAALKLGARAGMPFAVAARRFRQVTPVFRNPAWEASLGEELRALCLRYTPEAAMVGGGAGGGRAVLDMTGTPAARALRPPALAAQLHRDVLYATGLRQASVGAAATRLMAKVMARLAARDGGATGWCPPGQETGTLDPMGPACLPGLSPQCRERIKRYALDSVGQIRGLGRAALAARFGGEGEKLYTLACGLDLEGIRMAQPGIQAETALEEDINDEDGLGRMVRLTADKLVFQLRKAGLQADKLILAIRYADGKAARKTCAIRPRTDEFRILADKAREMFLPLYQRRVALRAITLIVPAPKPDTGQTDLFASLGDGRQKALGDALAKIRGRSGFAAILSGANVETE